jgi:hypothetical protein
MTGPKENEWSNKSLKKAPRAHPKLMYPDRLTSAAKAGNGCQVTAGINACSTPEKDTATLEAAAMIGQTKAGVTRLELFPANGRHSRSSLTLWRWLAEACWRPRVRRGPEKFSSAAL